MIEPHITVIGVPFNGIGIPPEQENPAQAIRDAGLIDLLKSRGLSVTDLGDLQISRFNGQRDELTHVLNLAAGKKHPSDSLTD